MVVTMMTHNELSEMMRRIWEEHNKSINIQKRTKDDEDSMRFT